MPRRETPFIENHFYHIHSERADYSAPTCTVELSANLLSNNWSTVGLEFVGESPVLNNFKTVTNKVPTPGKEQQFIRLKVEKK